ncbi:hypothetical protein, partial [Bilophila wadsworthia]|uniref:hypothetical protein n=1 Tax=Bilophila wadsworthia TaxID=35833 RepID=UPI00242FA616
AGHIVLRTSVEGEEKPFPVWEAAFLFVPVRCCARTALCGGGEEGAFSGQKRRRGSGIAGFPFVQAIDWPCSPFLFGCFFAREKDSLCPNGIFFAASAYLWREIRPFEHGVWLSDGRFFQKYFCIQKIF